MMKMEIRSNSVVISGYVNVPERKSRVMPSIRGKFTESIAGGVFKRALEKAEEVKLLFNHNEKRELGSTKNNLTLREDEIGLYAEATVEDEEVRQLAIDNKLTGWSFGFRVNEDKWAEGEEGIQHRTINDLELLEVSVLSVTPAYYATKVESRDSKDDAIIEQRAVDNITVEIKEDEKLDVNVDGDEPQDEERLFLCNKHYVDTLLRIAKEKGQF